MKNHVNRRVAGAIFAAGILIASAVPAGAVTIGAFGPGRINCVGCDLEAGAFYGTLRPQLAVRGDTINTIATLSAASLAGIDVFYTSLLKSTGAVEGALSAVEQIALSDFVTNGGTLFSAGDFPTVQAPYNTFLNPFGISFAPGQSTGTATMVGPANSITSGPNGAMGSFVTNTTGLFDPAPGQTVLAQIGPDIVALQKTVGLGQVVAFGDFNMFMDSGRGPNELALFLNVLDSDPVAAVPLPATLPLMVTGLIWLGWVARRRKG